MMARIAPLMLSLVFPLFAAAADPDSEAASFQAAVAREFDRAAEGEREDAAKGLEAEFFRFEESAFHARLAGGDPDVYREVESSWMDLIAKTRAGAPPAGLIAARDRANAALERGRRAVGGGTTPFRLFTESFIILLREGFEAILVLGAIIAYLRKTGRRDALRPLYGGALAAVGASVALYVLARTAFPLSGRHQEALEGATMLVAVVVLFWVSYWLISKAEGTHWQKFIRGRVEEAVTAGGLWGFGSLAFLVVFREGFETILFYRALLASAGGEFAGGTAVAGGVAAAAVLLAVLYVGIVHLGLRIPIRPFFGVTGALLYFLAFKFAGTGVAELQAGKVLPRTPLSWIPDHSGLQGWLGVFPTVESAMAQSLLLLAVLGGLVWSFWIAPYREPAETRAPGRVPLWAVGILLTLGGAAVVTTVGLLRLGEGSAQAAAPGPDPFAVPAPYAGRTNPTPDTPETLARGRAIFEKTCILCHGPAGKGDGVASAGLKPPPADLRLQAAVRADDYLFWRVTEGKPPTAMTGFKASLPEADRWAVIRYVRALPRTEANGSERKPKEAR